MSKRMASAYKSTSLGGYVINGKGSALSSEKEK